MFTNLKKSSLLLRTASSMADCFLTAAEKMEKDSQTDWRAQTAISQSKDAYLYYWGLLKAQIT